SWEASSESCSPARVAAPSSLISTKVVIASPPVCHEFSIGAQHLRDGVVVVGGGELGPQFLDLRRDLAEHDLVGLLRDLSDSRAHRPKNGVPQRGAVWPPEDARVD